LRLLSAADPAVAILGLAVDQPALSDSISVAAPQAIDLSQVSGATWDAALVATHAETYRDNATSTPSTGVLSISGGLLESEDLSAGLNQLDRYLSRAWYRAAIPAQMHEDCSQAVYATLLQQLGSSRFDNLVSEVGHSGIREVLSRETNEGVDFFRAVDMVKKRAQREKVHQSFDSMDLPISQGNSQLGAWREALREAIDHSLSPREATLINETLKGRTPAEIAESLGVAPKTISNEKVRVIQKLRELLLSSEVD